MLSKYYLSKQNHPIFINQINLFTTLRKMNRPNNIAGTVDEAQLPVLFPVIGEEEIAV